MRHKLLLLFIGSFSYSLKCQINLTLVKQDITYLSSYELKGRGTSSAGEKKAAEYIASRFKNLGLLPLVNKDYYFRFKYKKNASPHDTIITSTEEFEGINVIGFLDNKAKYTIIVGAHYDHLGLGYDHNSLDPSPEGKIHPGADDNASGTAGVLEIARYFSENRIQENCNFLFMCFSGEELGLLGSKKWCEHPDISLNTINYMINMDMIGRLNDSTKNLYVYGNGTSPVWDSLLNKTNSYFHLVRDSSGVGPSDHTSFYLQNIPVLHFFTGAHSDYHKPSDVVEKINFQGESKVLNFIIKLIEASNHLDKFIFLKTKSQNVSPTKFKVTMGVMPDYSYEGKGLRIDAVIANRPAELAGLKGGDVVVRMDDMEINNIQDYMKALGQFHKGSKALIKILRGTENLSFEIEFK